MNNNAVGKKSFLRNFGAVVFYPTVFITCLVFSLTFSSCSTLGFNKAKVEPVNVLSNDSVVYARIPVKQYSGLISSVAKKMTDAKDSDINQAIKRLDEIYIGYGRDDKSSKYEVVVTGNVPKLVFKGWTKQTYTGDFGLYPYYFNSKNNLEIAYARKDLLCAASKTYPLIKNYETALLDNTQTVKDEGYLWWFDQVSDDILFYINRNDASLSRMLGLSIPLNYQAAYGKIVWIGGTTYALDINLQFSDERVAKTLQAALKLTAGLLKINVKALDSLTLNISGITIEESSILDLIN